MSVAVNDVLAWEVEAADRWLEVMFSYGLSDAWREGGRRRKK
ncbi:hypothetical protein RX799_04235 [Klebsiella oxytoca]